MFSLPHILLHRHNNRLKNNKGFTLMEVIIVAFITALVVTGLGELLFKCMDAQSTISINKQLRESINVITEEIGRHIRSGYNISTPGNGNELQFFVADPQSGSSYHFCYRRNLLGNNKKIQNLDDSILIKRVGGGNQPWYPVVGAENIESINFTKQGKQLQIKIIAAKNIGNLTFRKSCSILFYQRPD